MIVPDGAAESSPLLQNSILAALPADDQAAIFDDLRLVALARGQTTNQIDQPIRHVDFPLDAMISIMATFANGINCEVAFVGCEGFVEADAALHAPLIGRSSVCQIPGTVARMRAEVFSERIATMPSFSRLVLQCLRTRLYITEQIAACNLRHMVVQRLARWLLTTADQLERDQIGLTQEAFAVMLGVRRAGVSEAAAALQRSGAIRVERATLTVIDRTALAAAACECYDAIRNATAAAYSPASN